MIEQLPIEIFWIMMGVFAVILGIGLVWKQGVFTMIAGIFLIMIFLPVTSFAYGAVWIEDSSTEISRTTDSELEHFEDLYTTNAGWTQVGSLVTVDSGTADMVDFADANGGSDRRVHKALGTTLPNDSWILDTEFIRDENANTFALLVALTDGTGNLAASSMDGIYVIIDDGANCDTVGYVYVGSEDSGSTANHGLCTIEAGAIATTYYVRLERSSATAATISVFSDSGRTVHVTGSPVAITIPATLVSLTTIQHQVYSTASSGFKLDGKVDNTSIYENVPVQASIEITNAGHWESPDPIEIDFTIKALIMVFAGLMMMFGWWQGDFENPFGDSV